MNDPHDRVGVARPESGLWWLRGRAGRREYWANVGAIILVSVVFSHMGPVVSAGLNVVLIFAQVRRLHDFDRTGWWALVALIVQLAPALAVFFATRSEDAAIAAAAIPTLVAIVWIGAVPGTPGDNRYGPTPPFTVRRVLTGR